MDIKNVSSITGKAIQKGVEEKSVEKVDGVSKFDKVLSREMEITGLKMDNIQFNENILTKSDVKQIERSFRAEIEKRGKGSEEEILKEKIVSLREKIGSVSSKVPSIKKSQFSESVNNYLKDAESRFKKLDSVIRNLESGGKKYSMKDLLKIQYEIQTVTQNVEMLSKIVDQISSGLKTIMQTQV